MIATPIPKVVIDRQPGLVHSPGALTKSELLERVEAAAASRAEIARVLTLPPARITEMFAGKRDLSFDEARTLIRHYKIEDAPSINIEDLARDHGLALVDEIDLALGMGATYLHGDEPEVKGGEFCAPDKNYDFRIDLILRIP